MSVCLRFKLSLPPQVTQQLDLAKPTAASQSLVCAFFPSLKINEINRVHLSAGNRGEAALRVIQSAHSEAQTETDERERRMKVGD